VQYTVALLFYRWVERRHKILLAKVVGVGILAIVAIALIAYLRQHAESSKRAREIASVEVRVDSLAASQLSITICNRTRRMLQRVDFRVSGLIPGRSTPHPVEETPEYTWRRFTDLSSDYNTSAGTCIALNWQGSFRTDFNRFVTETTAVQFAPK
jgi:hypothetical protein